MPFIVDTALTSTLEWDKFFKSELQKVCEQTREIMKHAVLSEKELGTLKSIANTFYDKFSNSPIPVQPPQENLDYLPEMYSTSVLLPNSCLSVPYFFINVFRQDINFSFGDEFAQNLYWSELIGLIFNKWVNRRIKLTKTIALICKALSRYDITSQIYRYPITTEMIANRTRQSLSIVKMTVPSMYNSTILFDMYLVNNWKVGWEIFLITYSSQNNHDFDDYDKMTISLEFCAGKKTFRVIQYPMLDDGENLEKLQTLVKKCNGNLYQIQSTDFHWDLSQLHPNDDKSFKQVPNFLDTSHSYIEPNFHFESESNSTNWITDSTIDRSIIKKGSKSQKIENNDIKILSKLKKERIIKVLNFLVEHGAPLINYETTADAIGIPVNEFGEIIRYLIKNHVIALARRFIHLGAGREYAFIIENTQSELNAIIKQSLLQCVFSYFYESKDILAGRVQVPDLWVSYVMEFFTRLQFRHPELSISYGQRLIGYNLFSPNVKFPKDYFLNEFGTYLIQKEKN